MAKKVAPTHPGTILSKEFLTPAEIAPAVFAKHIGLSESALSRLLAGKTSLSIKVAHKLAKALGTSVEFWVNLQTAVDLHAAKADKDLAAEVRKIKKLPQFKVAA